MSPHLLQILARKFLRSLYYALCPGLFHSFIGVYMVQIVLLQRITKTRPAEQPIAENSHFRRGLLCQWRPAAPQSPCLSALSAHAVVYMSAFSGLLVFGVPIMLFIDMIHVQWRHPRKTGKIVVRGADDVLLFVYALLPDSTRSPMVEKTGGLCFYYQTHNCRMHESPPAIATGVAEPDKKTPVLYAISVGIDAKKHPVISILHQESRSEKEQMVGTVDITYNTMMFKRGFFADKIMHAQGYGILLLCHTSQDTHDARALQSPPAIIHFVNWRQSRIVMQKQVKHMQRLPPDARASTTHADINIQHADTANEGQLASTHAASSQWDNSLYSSLKHSVCSTFNLLR